MRWDGKLQSGRHSVFEQLRLQPQTNRRAASTCAPGTSTARRATTASPSQRRARPWAPAWPSRAMAAAPTPTSASLGKDLRNHGPIRPAGTACAVFACRARWAPIRSASPPIATAPPRSASIPTPAPSAARRPSRAPTTSSRTPSIWRRLRALAPTPGTVICAPYACSTPPPGTAGCFTSCTDKTSCATGDFLVTLAASACCSSLAQSPVILVDSVNGVDKACCWFANAQPCATLTYAMNLINDAQQPNVVIQATVMNMVGTWGKAEVYPDPARLGRHADRDRGLPSGIP